MSDTIIVALVALAGTIISGFISGQRTNNLLEYRMKKLEEKVDKHNQVIERTFALEERAALMDEKIKVANHRIEDLEKK